jgi:microbial collagenase
MACTSDDLIPLAASQDLISYLQSHDWNCLQYLWTYDANVRASYTTTHMDDVLKKIATVAQAYDGTNSQHLHELLFYVRVGYYHKFYHANDPGLFDPQVIHNDAVAAFGAFAMNAHRNDFTTVAAQIANEWINGVDASGLWDNWYAQLTGYAADFINAPARWQNYDQQFNVYSLFLAVERALAQDPAFDNEVDANFVSTLQQYAVNLTLPPGAAYLVPNAIVVLGAIGAHVPGQKANAIAALNAAVNAQPANSPPWGWAVFELCSLNACPTINGQMLTWQQAQAQIDAALFPNPPYVFDDGAILVKTQVALDKIQAFYHAIKQVAAQFNRVTETIPPLEGDPNGVLKVTIYASQQDYQNYQPLLTGFATNNGGLYYEQNGTFYTYDRPDQPGNYTLEELFRHEYSHYLIERFLTAGLWGQTLIYQDAQGNPSNRMVWFDEGFAEFLTGSADVGGVKPRKHLANLVAADGPNGRMNLSQVFQAAYNGPTGFTFYRYACFFFNFIYTQRRDLLRQFIDHVRSAGLVNDAATQAAVIGFDALTSQVGNDPQVEAAYQAYLDQIVANAANLNDPTTAVPPLNALDSNDVQQIQTQVRTTRIGYLASASVSTKALDTRFTCRGTLSGSVGNSQDVDAAWAAFNENLEEVLTDLRTKQLNNFQYTVARFGRIRFQAEGNQVYPMADYYVEGPLGAENSVPPAPAARVQADFKSTRLGGGAVCTFANGMVTCKLSISTQAFPQATPDAILQQQLADDLDELRDQVYAINPPYYRDFNCDFSGPAQTIAYQGNQKYLVRPVTATVKEA